MTFQLILLLIVVSLFLHTPWELAQTKALSTCAGKPWRLRLGNCSIGIVSDVLYTVGLYYLISWWLTDEVWLHKAGILHYGFVLIVSFIGAYLTELVAQRLDWWHFIRKVPHFPKSLGDVAVTPVLQLPLLVALTYLLTQFILF
ncbi:MAG: hypothetical protein WD035_08890 [Balneolaceae bacterium]